MRYQITFSDGAQLTTSQPDKAAALERARQHLAARSPAKQKAKPVRIVTVDLLDQPFA